MDIVPENIFGALAEGKVLAVMFFALCAGIALAYLQDSSDERLSGIAADIRRFVDGGVALVFLIIRGVLQYSPTGVFALIAVVVGEKRHRRPGRHADDRQDRTGHAGGPGATSSR